MIYTVTLNPSIDYIAVTDEMILGKTNRTQKETIFPGGKGINVSIVCKNLGAESVALGLCAGFTGKEIERLLYEQDINNEFVSCKSGYSRINVKIHAKEESELNGMGPEVSEEELNLLLDKLCKLEKGDFLILAGSIPSSMPKNIYSTIVENVKDKGVFVVVDTTGKQLMETLSHHPFLIKPNIDELSALFGKDIQQIDDVIEYAKKLKDMGAINVMVSLGSEGAVLIDEYGKTHTMKAPKGQLKNSVGAGDSMVAGFVTKYIETKDYDECFKWSVCTGSASAFSDDMATYDEVLALYNMFS